MRSYCLTDVGVKRNMNQDFVYASDELYLLAGLPLPEDEAYEGYPQYENGVGMLRYLMNEFYDALEDAEYDGDARFLTIATGTAAAPAGRNGDYGGGSHSAG